MTRLSAITAAALALCLPGGLWGCSSEPESASANNLASDSSKAPPHSPENSEANQAGRGGNPVSPLELRPVDLLDKRANRPNGELGCSFSREPGGKPLLVAAADVLDNARAEALVNPAGGPVKLTADRTGGFNALTKGARFTGPGGLTATVVVTGDEPLSEEPRIAMESPRLPATITVVRDDRTVRIGGFFECGP